MTSNIANNDPRMSPGQKQINNRLTNMCSKTTRPTSAKTIYNGSHQSQEAGVMQRRQQQQHKKTKIPEQLHDIRAKNTIEDPEPPSGAI